MAEITENSVSLSQNWGVSFNDYAFGGKAMDFQDLMVAVAEKRAVAVEGEVAPMATRIRDRNDLLESLGLALSELTSAQATLDSDADGDDKCSYTFSQEAKDACNRAYGMIPSDNDSKKWLEYHIQRVKSTIDALNNAAQTDMSRLQSLVDRRDESYTTASTLMSAVSDTRANLIGNL